MRDLIEDLIRDLNASRNEDRDVASDLLVEQGAEAIPALAAALHKDALPPKWRDQAFHLRLLQVLERIGIAAVPAILDALAVEDSVVSLEASLILRRFGPLAYQAEVEKYRTRIPLLIMALRQPGAAMRAAWILGRLGPAAGEATAALREALNRCGLYLSEYANDYPRGLLLAIALGRVAAAPESLRCLMFAVDDPRSEVWADANEAIRHVLTNNPISAEVFWDHILFTFRIGEFFQYPPPHTDFIARLSPFLMVLGPAAVLRGIETLDDGNGECRTFYFKEVKDLIRILGKQGQGGASALLQLLGKHNDADVLILELLGSIGPDAAEAIPALIEMIRNPDGELRHHMALQALRAIDWDRAETICRRDL